MKTFPKHWVLVIVLLLVPASGFAKTTAVDYYKSGVEKKAKADLDGAVADFNRAIELNPKYAEAYNSRGLAKKAKGDLHGATADYNQARELNPKLK